MIRLFVLVAIAIALGWIAIAEILARDYFLGANTVLAALFVLLSPWLFEPAHSHADAGAAEPE